ncbi:MAG: hypothetical protein R3B45_10910 [Bdellovibrionota bacterium]
MSDSVWRADIAKSLFLKIKNKSGLNETIQLVEKKYSDIDLSEVRKKIAVERTYHSEPIHGDMAY